MIRAVIFDFNGVLVDDEPLHFALFREVLGGLGVSISEHDYHGRYLGLDDRGCFEAALLDAGQSADRARVDELIARKALRYAEEAGRGLRFFPGAADCLAVLAGRWPLAINSGALRPEIELALNLLDRRDRVAVIVSAEDTTRCKPDPEGYTLALQGLRRRSIALSDLAPADCLVIEDSLAGIESAKGAGMRAVGVPNTYDADRLRGAGADEIIDGLTRLTPDWIADRFGAPGNDPVAVPEPVGLLLSRDLIFTAKVTGTARELGRRVLVAGNPAQAAAMIDQWRPKVVFVDLSAGDLVATPALIAYRRSAGPGARFVAFGAHVDTAALDAARDAGCDLVLPRSKFSAELPDLVRRSFEG
jgi:beta-phosphoglucomutase-like phosphatase (HAD superfamily)/CheY-like chemotaxis protein